MGSTAQSPPPPDAGQGTWIWVPAPPPSDNLVVEFAQVLGRWKLRLSGIAVAAGLIAFLTVWLLPRFYESTAVAAQVDSGISPPLASLGGQISGLAGLAGMTGLKLPTQSSSRGVVTLATLESQAFLVDFARSRGILPSLFPGRYDASAETWKNTLFSGRGEPSEAEIYEVMSDRVTVSQDAETGLVDVVFAADSPGEARRLANQLLADINERLRTKDIAEAENSIAYLESQIRQTTVAEIKQIFYRLIEEQTKTAMLARVTEDYALRVVDPPSLPDEPAPPTPILAAILAAAFAALLTICLLLIRFAFASRA